MIKKLFLLALIIVNFAAIYYLVIPLPQLPDLRDSVKSDLPGDTTQLKNVSAYFTNLTRSEVINFYKANYNGPFRLQINHPPEKAKEIIVDTIQSYYLEEFVLPFRQSIYINGYDWQNDVFTKPEKRIANKLFFRNIEYQSKITIKTFPTTIFSRLLVWFSMEIFLAIIIWCYYRSFKTKP